MIQANTVKRNTSASKVSKSRYDSPAEPTKSKGDFSQKIAQKAYELYVARGCQNGHDVEDWIQAEKIIKGA